MHGYIRRWRRPRLLRHDSVPRTSDSRCPVIRACASATCINPRKPCRDLLRSTECPTIATDSASVRPPSLYRRLRIVPKLVYIRVLLPTLFSLHPHRLLLPFPPPMDLESSNVVPPAPREHHPYRGFVAGVFSGIAKLSGSSCSLRCCTGPIG